MNTHRWMRAHVIATVGILITLNGFLLIPIPDAHAESFHIKPGAWDIAVSGMTVSSELSAKMTPAQRAQLEQRMKAREGKPHPSCITEEDLNQDRIIKEMEDEDEDPEVQCKIKVLSKSSSKLVLDQLCPGPPSSTTHFIIETKTADSFTAIGDRSVTGSGKQHITIRGTWIGPICDGLDE